MRTLLCRLVIVLAVSWVSYAWAFPDTERMLDGLSEPPLDLGLSTAVGYRIDNDDQRLFITFGDTFKVVDLGTFDLLPDDEQPFDLASDEDLGGSIRDIALNTVGRQVLATQDGGFLLTYDLDDLSAEPVQTLIETGTNLTFIEFDESTGLIYMFNADDSIIFRYDQGDNAITGQANIVTGTGAQTVNDMRLIPALDTIYVTTTSGRVFIVQLANFGATPTQKLLTTDGGVESPNLEGIAAAPSGSRVLIVNESDKVVHALLPPADNNAEVIGGGYPVFLERNSDLSHIEVADVTNPSGTFAFVMGSKGMSVFDINNGTIQDLGTETGDPLTLSGTGPLLASDDGYVYVSYGKIAVVSDNPFSAFTDISYSDGGSSLGVGESVALTFQTDEASTYTLRIGGDTTGNGILLVDDTGSSTGTVAADNDVVTVTINYDDNADLFDEGDNTLWVFVEDSENNTGRRATTVTVDNPPPPVTILSAGFGNEKIFVNIERLDISDIASYQVYVDPDETVPPTSTTVAGITAQPGSGNTVTVTVTGLENGVTYFIAAEAVDNEGNVSTSRTTTFADGTPATGVAEPTFGPAGLAGETGCTLIPRRSW